MSAADKQDLRDELLQERRARTLERIEEVRAAVREHVVSAAARFGWRSVAAYVPLRTEPGSVELLQTLAVSGVRVLVPITLADRDLDWSAWGSDVPLGVDAIGTVDAVLVPALAVAHDGTRLGRGGGSYDRALTRVRPGAPIVALVYTDEVRSELPSEPWDVAVTAYVTPDGWTPIGLRNT
jgi:5-formyltetrahydrofolate cyclo-ligase